jgi:putative flippase GtrA
MNVDKSSIRSKCQWILLNPLVHHRFLKFGSVGLLGTLVNFGMLTLGQEYLFSALSDPGLRLDVSLSLAIVLSTLNNFSWNRLWTWRDRREMRDQPIIPQLGQYFLASGLAILLQIVLTKILAVYWHYLLANGAAIALAAFVSYRLNDAWTFGLRQWRDIVLPRQSLAGVANMPSNPIKKI